MGLIPAANIPDVTASTERRGAKVPSLIVVLLVMLAFSSSIAGTQADIVQQRYTYTFGQTAVFSITAPSETTAEEATLYLTIDGQTYGYNVTLKQGQGEHQRDLRELPFPPFTPITYWWTYTDDQGTLHKTDKDIFRYEDNRFRWETLEDGDITLYWVSGETTTMIKALDIAKTSAAEIQNTLEVPAMVPVTLYVYPSLPDLQSALLLAGQDWVGGQAYPEFGVLLVTLPASSEAILKMNRDIPHEMTHKMLYELTGAQGYAALPAWLVEGLASYFERSPDPAYSLALQQAREDNALIPFETLCAPFSGDRDHAILAYAQSQSLIQYIRQTYGWSRLRALVHDYADGLDCVTGTEKELGITLNAVEQKWRAWLMTKDRAGTSNFLVWNNTVLVSQDLAPWLLLAGLLLLPSIIFWLSTRFSR